MNKQFFSRVLDCILTADPLLKVEKTQQCFDDLNEESLELIHEQPVHRIELPGRPDKPELVDPRKVSKRSIKSPEGRVVLAHAVAHIEFNAINLALDAAYRFRNMPPGYYKDWMRVAKEEAEHFTLMTDYLQAHNHHYGDFSAHNGLWEMALKTDQSVLERMALVPRVLEARGLDVTPGMIKKLDQAGDQAFVKCLELIYREEIGHVAIGSRWFQYSCEQEGVNPRETFIDLLKEHMNNGLKGPFDEWSRLQAGFSEEEMLDIKNLENGIQN